MEWADYYDGFYDWADSTQMSRISGLTDFGSDCSAEVLEVAQSISDDKAVIRLINKALAGGVRFAVDEIMELTIQLDKPTLSKLVASANEPFSKEQLEELYMLIDDDVFEKTSEDNNIDIFADECENEGIEDAEEIDDDVFLEEEPVPKLGFFTKLGLALGVASVLEGNEKKHNGHCDGDCAHCPPHYGYRYGRWYYGHHHQHGCEFGGNKGL